MLVDMRLPLRVVRSLLLATALGVVSHSAAAQSFGFYSMPSRFTQYLGYGYGAGHHAPIVKSPNQHPPRVPKHVRAPEMCGPLYVAPYAPIGCYGETCYPAAAQLPVAEPIAVPVENRQTWQYPAP